MNRDNLLKKFDKYKHLSQKETDNGTVLIGNPYKNKTRILNQINSINTAEEFKALLNANTQIADEISKTLDVSVDEFINNINEKNLLVNKKNIKDKLTIENKMYYKF